MEKLCYAGVLAVRTAALAACLAAQEELKPKRSRQHRLTRPALVHPQSRIQLTGWRMLLLNGCETDFVASLGITKYLFLRRVLPLLEREATRVNHGSPFRNGPKIRGRRKQLECVDMIGLALWHARSRCAHRELCVIFGLVPSTLPV